MSLSIKILQTPDLRVIESTVNRLQEVLDMAKSGEVTECTIHYRKADGSNFISESHTMNRHEAAGWLLDMAFERLR